MRRLMMVAVLGSAFATGAVALDRSPPVNPAGKPPVAPVRPVAETYFGTTVTDPYRYMEALDSDTRAWMTAQGEYTGSIFASIPKRKAYGERMTAFGNGFGFANSWQDAGGRGFYLERGPGLNAADLMVRDKDGKTRRLIDVNALIKSTGEPHAINYFSASNDGSRVAVGLSKGGSEDASLWVYDVASGARIAGPVTRAQFGGANWSRDDSGLFFLRLREMAPGVPITEKYNDSEAVFWNLKDAPVALAGARIAGGPKIDTIGFPVVAVHPKVNKDLLIVGNGVENEVGVYVADRNSAQTGAARWAPVFDRTAGVTGLAMWGDELYVLTHKDAPTFKVLRMSLTPGAITGATEVVPASPGRVIENIVGAKDGLYLIAREGLYGKLYKLDGQTLREVALPMKGTVGSLVGDPALPGVVITVEGWTTPPTTLRYDPATGAFADLKLGVRPATYDPAMAAAHDLTARSWDGVAVPLSVIAPTGPRTPRPMLMEAYGSYGVPILPSFTPREMVFVEAGGAVAFCHVRGGGDLGDQWRLDGKGAKKPNTWKDFIACAETLIAEGWTTADMLTIKGVSAGGIAVGRATVERPDLFAGAIWAVPMASALRAEFQQNGPANIPEFGTVKDEQGFRDLLAMDAYQGVVDGKTYPGVLLTTGMNDPRVDPWQPGKAAARLQASGSPNTVLLRVEAAGGHGIGSTREQRDAEEADQHAFVFWRAGLSGWQPVK